MNPNSNAAQRVSVILKWVYYYILFMEEFSAEKLHSATVKIIAHCYFPYLLGFFPRDLNFYLI